VRADLNFARLALFGLSSADVLDTIQAAFAGQRVAQIYQGDRVVDLAVSAQASLRRDPEAVGDLLLRSTSGVSAPLKTVANVYLTDGRATITHDDGLRRQVVLADPADPQRFLGEARAALPRVALPPGAFLEITSTAEPVAAAQRDFLINYAFVALGILALLAIAYDARTAALIIASSLLSFVGGAIAVFLMGGLLTGGAIAGFVTLFALSMRSGILLFARLEDVILAGQMHFSAETVAAVTRDRLTPILMTALLVALALLPFALQAGNAGRELLGPMAIVILGGLAAGALAALFILPAMILAFWRPGYARRARNHGHA
jgi:Cu/Ag efflux pump CusA